jgi:hypothetical protein
MRHVLRIRFALASLLLGYGCAANAPAPSAGPTSAERVAHQEGYLDGKKAEANAARAELEARDAEILALRTRVAEFERGDAERRTTDQELNECREALATEHERSAALQTALDARAFDAEVARAKALGAVGRKRELAECHALSMLCDTLLRAFLAAAASDEERRALANVGVSQEAAPALGSSVRKSPAPAPEDPVDEQPCCRVCHAGYACGNSCISRAKQCHKPPGCACDG